MNGMCDVFHENGPWNSPFYPGNDLHIIPQSDALSEIWLVPNHCNNYAWGGIKGQRLTELGSLMSHLLKIIVLLMILKPLFL